MSTGAESSEPGLQADQRLLDRAWLRIGVGLLVAGQAMAFSFAVNLTPPDGTVYWILHGGLMLSAAGVLGFLGGDLVGSALAALRQRRVSIDLLFLVTLAGAFGGSLVATFTHTGSVYYEVVAILIVVHTTGKMLGARSRVAALQAVDETRERFDACDVRCADGTRRRKAVRALAADDIVLVAPGAPISVDGEIVAGQGYVQETSMTGEWRPVRRGPGECLLAGTFSVDGSFEIRSARGPRRLDAVLTAVAEARLAPSELQRQADRFVAWFLPVVTGVSAATFAFWILRAPWDRALFNAMAVLLVACPCAAGLATPVAVWGGLARLASFGLVARTGDFLDALARCDFVCLDKTGTLSRETLAVRAWRIEPAFREREAWLQAAVAAAEEGLRHPIAVALLQNRPRSGDMNHQSALAADDAVCHVLRDKPESLPEDGGGVCHVISDNRLMVRKRRIEPGLGVVALVENGAGPPAEIRVGERALGGEGANLPARDDQRGELAPAQRRTAGKPAPAQESATKEVFVFVDGARAATIEVAETWREGLDAALRELQALGVGAEILTGDASAATGHFGGAAMRAGLTPGEKLERVCELVAAGRCVAFLGDGVNDAAAMSAAQAPIAMQAGAELARAAAMAVFAGDDLRFLPRAIRVAQAARRSIRTNLLFAAAYNTAGMTLAAAGLLHPVAAALLMVGSSAFVSVRALRSVAAGQDGP